LEQERKLVTGIIDASLDPLFQVNEKGIIQLVNKAATTQFGWTRDEFIGSNISMIVGGEHAARHGQYMERYLKTGVTRVMGTKRELPARRKDGSEFPIQLSLVEIKADDGDERLFCGFILDLTEQKEHMNEIERREAFTNKIIEGSYDALLVTDKDGNITRVNTTAIRKFEAGSDKLCSLSILELLSPEDSAWLKQEMDQYLTSGVPITEQRELEAVRPCGDAFPVLIGVSSLEGPDGEPYFAIYMHDLSEHKRMLKIEAEKSAAEFLLFNMLPETIAGRLKDDPSHIAESHSFAAVLFADIVGFTSMSSTMEPHEVVSMLNELFSMFDEVVEEYGLNKIKTIGDCYMTTSVPGIEGDEVEHGRRMCYFALDMIEVLHKYNRSEGRDRKLGLRVGINVGPVVAGVVGTKRFLYDLWGDAVNLASRMESTGVPGRVQAPAHVAELMKDDFDFERRGMVDVKGKGKMETYFLTGRKKPYVKTPEVPKQLRRPRLNSKEDLNYVRESMRAFEASLLDIIDGPDQLDRVGETEGE
jgi:PAS domain S-box-containing protein